MHDQAGSGYANDRNGTGGMVFLVGIALGALTAALLTPMSGRETRNKLKARMDAAKSKGTDVAGEIASKAENGARKISEKTQELREKITSNDENTPTAL